MKWKNRVEIISEHGNVILSLGKNRCPMVDTDYYLAEAIKKGIHKEEELKKLIMDHDESNEIVAGLTLAKFILDYQSYLEENNGYYEITM